MQLINRVVPGVCAMNLGHGAQGVVEADKKAHLALEASGWPKGATRVRTSLPVSVAEVAP